MRKKIKATELKTGMYIDLSGKWFKHNFLKNKFIIDSQSQIDKIINSGINDVFIHTDKGVDKIEAVECISHGDTPEKPAFEIESYEAPKDWHPEKIVPPEFIETIRNKKMLPKEKAVYIYKHSLEIMKKLLESPVTENIQEAKKGISEIVDVILSERDTSNYLLRITSHDFYTYTHSVNVGVLSILLSNTLFKNSDAHNMHELGAGFFLHDIGKTRIHPDIINKPGRLTDDEMKDMRKHPFQGYKILQETNQLTEECRIIVLQHHERKNGTGYPRRLKNEDIHIYGRIGCIADVYDALTTERSYKPALKPFEALSLMRDRMAEHFNDDIFSNFVMMLHNI